MKILETKLRELHGWKKYAQENQPYTAMKNETETLPSAGQQQKMKVNYIAQKSASYFKIRLDQLIEKLKEQAIKDFDKATPEKQKKKQNAIQFLNQTKLLEKLEKKGKTWNRFQALLDQQISRHALNAFDVRTNKKIRQPPFWTAVPTMWIQKENGVMNMHLGIGITKPLRGEIPRLQDEL